MKALNKGWGLVGRDFSSGWNWAPGTRMDIRGQFHHFHQFPVGQGAAQHQTVAEQFIPQFVVHFVAVTVPFADAFSAVGLFRQGAGIQLAGISPSRMVPPLISTLICSGIR